MSWPRRLRVNSKGDFIWAESNPPVYVFDAEGRFLTTFGAAGQGPGELGSVDDFDLDARGNIYVFDVANRRVSVFDTAFKFTRSYAVETDNLKRIAIDSEGNLFRLREAWYNGPFPAVAKHNSTGAVLIEWGNIPNSARIQSTLVGGGIEVDDNVYYGYISDHRIWKTDLTGDLQTVFDSQPTYYKGSDGRILEEGEMPGAMIQYWRNLSRVKALSLVPSRQLLFQVIQTKESDRSRTTIEVWHTDGFKIASDVETPGMRFLFHADAEFLYFVGISEEDGRNPPILVYEYSIGQRNLIVAP